MAEHTVPTLDEMAQAIEAKRVEVEEARERVEELKRPYEEAYGRWSDLEGELKKMQLGLDASKRSYMVQRALDDAGVAYDGPPLVAVEQQLGRLTVFYLVAVGPEGTGLYLHTPDRSHRYQGKSYAVMRDRLPEHVAAALATEGYGARAKAMEEAGFSISGGQESRPVYGSDELHGWQERSTGQFGKGTGSIKPLSPPEGGRWRWLKVREQEALPC